MGDAWALLDFLARHGHQPLSELRGLRLSELAAYQRAVVDRLKRETPRRGA